MPGSTRRARRVSLAALVLATLAWVPAAGAAAPQTAVPAVRVERGDRPAFVDGQGREVLLRGINVNQLGDYYAADAAKPTTIPLGREDFAQMRRLGFDVVRLVTNWSAWAPERGAFSAAYLARVRGAVRDAAAEGLATVVDLHQDSWGKDVATPAGTACPPGLGPAVGWDGAPSWASRFDGMSTCRAAETRELSPAVAQAFTNFFLDRDGIQTELVATWGRIAQALGNEPGVVGWDLFNEPHPGFLIGPDQSVALGRYYAAAIASVRAGERASGSRAHVAFFEPSVLWSGAGADALPAPGFTADEQIAFAPHLYAESITIDRKVGLTGVSVEQGFDAAAAAARSYGVPLWSGEWAWFGKPEDDGPKFARYLAQEDARGLGGAYWVWRQACGDPHVAGQPSFAGSLNPVGCPGDRPLGQAAAYARGISRGYPRLSPGRLVSTRGDVESGALRVTGSDPSPDGSCRLEAWLPDRGRGEPVLRGTNVDDLRLEAAPGGWVASGCARGAWMLEAVPSTPTATPATARRCTSRRVLDVAVRAPRGTRVRRATVRLGSDPARRVAVRGGRVRIDLRGRAAGRVEVRVRAVLRDGRVVSQRRVLRTCKRRR